MPSCRDWLLLSEVISGEATGLITGPASGVARLRTGEVTGARVRSNGVVSGAVVFNSGVATGATTLPTVEVTGAVSEPSSEPNPPRVVIVRFAKTRRPPLSSWLTCSSVRYADTALMISNCCSTFAATRSTPC